MKLKRMHSSVVKLGLVFFIVTLLGNNVAAQVAKYTNSYLQLGYSAQYEALGRSAQATSYSLGMERANPASLAQHKKRFMAGGSFSSIFTGMGTLMYAGVAMRLDSVSSASVSLLRFGVDGIQNTLDWRDEAGNDDYGRIRRFGIADYALFLSYGRTGFMWAGFAVGGTAKVLYRDEGGFATGVGLGVDLAANYSFGAWRFAAVVRDVTSTWVLWFIEAKKLSRVRNGKELNTTPARAAEGTIPSLELAVAYSRTFRKSLSWGATLCFNERFDGREYTPLYLGSVSFSPAVGLWGSYRNLVFLRLGAHQLQQIPLTRTSQALSFTPTAGIGLQGWGLRIDYAFSAPLATVSARLNHLVSISYSFGG